MIAPIIWLPVGLLLAYALPACYYDIRDREMPEGFWTLLWVISLPFTVALYLLGTYPLEMLLLSLAAVAVYFVLMWLHVFEGADFMYLMGISLFLVQNPNTGNILMPISFAIFLLASFVGFAILFQSPILRQRLEAQNLPGFPAMLPISLALGLTVWLA